MGQLDKQLCIFGIFAPKKKYTRAKRAASTNLRILVKIFWLQFKLTNFLPKKFKMLVSQVWDFHIHCKVLIQNLFGHPVTRFARAISEVLLWCERLSFKTVKNETASDFWHIFYDKYLGIWNNVPLYAFQYESYVKIIVVHVAAAAQSMRNRIGGPIIVKKRRARGVLTPPC